MLLFLLGSLNVWATDPDPVTCTFPSSGSISNDKITVNSVEWTISTGTETGSPTIGFGNAYSKTCIKFGSGAKNCYASVNLSTDYFSDNGYTVTQVDVLGLGSAARNVTFEAGGESTTENVAANSWTTLSLDGLSISGELSLDFSLNGAGFFIHEIVITYEEGGSTDPEPSTSQLSWSADVDLYA